MDKIEIYGIIEEGSYDKFIEDLNLIYEKDPETENITVCLNTPGGSVSEGLQIYFTILMLCEVGMDIHIQVRGEAASMGSVILLASENRSCTKDSKVMIHNPWTEVQGDADTLLEVSKSLKEAEEFLRGIYTHSTDLSESQLKTIMKREVTFDADEALKLGIVNNIDNEILYETLVWPYNRKSLRPYK